MSQEENVWDCEFDDDIIIDVVKKLCDLLRVDHIGLIQTSMKNLFKRYAKIKEGSEKIG